ncbi:uncharacterized protein F4822DRAFT_416789 [Hypoxylon trugodes]|uniref:uncharacterized protein n=1 Tax=Hypoxylon trugodes TaxID=326681 RepID=UPI00219FDC9D|nr:uncharacterized protein F4822DRAFT_416789 [Hypoxylon trugodes]KAI1384951.1 hypothetical protein F4822DRAFT_416789 [Hypoxylon trugodes]
MDPKSSLSPHLAAIRPPSNASERNIPIVSPPQKSKAMLRYYGISTLGKERPTLEIHHLNRNLGVVNAAPAQQGQRPGSSWRTQNGGVSSTKGRKSVTGPDDPRDKPEEDSNDDNDDDDDDENGPRRPRVKNKDPKDVDSRFLACPYFKHNPRKYIGREWRGCCGPGWTTVHRMKEHIYRRHRQSKFRCERCGEPFEEKRTLADHVRAIRPCALREVSPIDGLDSEQEAKLKSRKRTATPLSENEKWKQTYLILFPHVPDIQVPSPFYDYGDVPSIGIHDYEEYFHYEMQGDLKTTLEQEVEANLNIVEDEPKRRVVQWFTQTHLRLLDDFRKSRELDTTPSAMPSDRGPSNTDEVYLEAPRGAFGSSHTSLDNLTTTIEQPFTFGINDDELPAGPPISQYDFDFDFRSMPSQLMVELSSDGQIGRPSDSGYGSGSIQGSKTFSPESNQ